MKRLALGALALLLTSGALFVGGSKPAYACVEDPDCDFISCNDYCVGTGHQSGTCNWCTGACLCN